MSVGVLLVVALLLFYASLGTASAVFVQQNYATPQTPQSSVSVTYTGAQTVGNTNVLAIGWNDVTSNISSVTDSAGNAYQVAVPTFRGNGLSQAIYYAPNIKTAAAGSNRVTVSFNQTASYVDLRIAEYSGLATTSPFDVGTSATSGSGGTANSGLVTTSATNELLVGAGMTNGSFSGPGANFTQRVITSPDGDILEDRSVSTSGSYNATSPVTGAWVMQIAAFKTSGATSDTTPPTGSVTSPVNGALLSATVSVNATAADNVGVAGVQFLLDGTNLGAEDTISPYSVSWNTTTASNGSHSLTVSARDTAGNSGTSASVTVTVDNQAPTGTVIINNGAAATNSTAVTLNLAAVDTQGAVTQMRFSNDGTTFSTAVAYATTASWTLTTGAGTKTAFAQFKDAAGNWSASTSDSIVLDTTAPTITNITATNVTGNSATIAWTTSEAANSQIDYGLTKRYGVTTNLDSNLVLSHGVPISGLNPVTLYHYRVRSRDAAGNLTESADSTFTTGSGADTTPPSTPTNLSATPISPTQINLLWTASTDNIAVTGYKIFRGGAQIATTTSASFSDTGLAPDTLYIYAVSAFDAASNNSAQSASVSASTPVPDTIPPTVDITAPVANSTVSQNVIVSASSTDNIGVVGVQFLVDGTNLGAEDTTSPYSVSWNTTSASNGPHTVAARARDAAGNTQTSSIGVTVSNTQTTGLALGYSFDEVTGTTANDSSGNGNTATLNNGVAWVPGKYGSAVSFDGANDYLSIPNSTSTYISGTALTFSLWINPQPLSGGDSVILGKFWNATWTAPNYQYGLELDAGTTPHFYVGTTGGLLGCQMGSPLPMSQWSALAVVFNGTQVQFYLNGALVSTQPLSASITARGNAINVGADARPGQFYKGAMDDLRIYKRVLAQNEVQLDMNTPLGAAGSSDPTPPTVIIDSPNPGTQVSDIVTVTADAFDNVGVAGVQFYVDGIPTGIEDVTDPYGFNWDTRTSANGAHTLTARARDVSGNSTLSAPVTVNVANANFFQNEVLATGFALPTAIKFLPDGRLLVVELAGTIRILPSPYTTPDPTPFLRLTNVGSAGVQQGIYDIAFDPNFTSNHFYYIFYTAASPNRDRLSRFTANATLNGTVSGSEVILYEDPQTPNAEHHGGAINFGNDGKIYFTTGEHFNAGDAQLLTNPRGKIHRINPDGTVPTDNPFYDGAGPNWDSIWALGLRNPYRAYFDAPTNKLYIGDVGGNDYSTAVEEVDVGIRGANYGWPNCELGTCGNPNYTAAIYSYPHLGRDSAITGGFVYHGSQYPVSYQGSYFFADYTQNWIRRLTFDAQGNVNGVFNFEPLDGSLDGPYGDIVYLTEGPDGSLYYLDLGYSDISGTFGISKVRRIRYIQSNLPPTAIASANPVQGAAPLAVSFSSAGSTDPEGQPLTFLWTFGDGGTSTAANLIHSYLQAGQYTARLTVSDGVNNTIGSPITISVGNPPAATISSPTDGSFFIAGDVITFRGDATDVEDGVLPASSFTWNIDFLHEGHVHPGTPVTGVKNGTFTIPTSGHDFSGFTRYRIKLTVTDSNGLQSSTSVTIFPRKVNLSFDTIPSGLTLYLDGIAKTTPFVYDTLVNFNHMVEARNQSSGTTTYTFASWSDGGAQTHTLTVPSSPQSYVATFNVGAATPITMGETTVFGGNDSGNGNLLIVQNATLSQSATIQSLSFYVTAASGNLRLGVYDATGAGGGPGTLKAQTNAFTPVVGWNTANVIAPVSLPAGSYWLAYFPSSSSLNFATNFSIGSYKYANFSFGPMPLVFPAIAGQGTTHWSLYATLTP